MSPDRDQSKVPRQSRSHANLGPTLVLHYSHIHILFTELQFYHHSFIKQDIANEMCGQSKNIMLGILNWKKKEHQRDEAVITRSTKIASIKLNPQDTSSRCKHVVDPEKNTSRSRERFNRVRTLFQKQISTTFPGLRLIFQGL